jgi:predicted  nucleic acid-binding Zn-ribbon protein
MSDKIKIKYLTGVCPNCGANQFHFDEKEQTFVCEFCNTEVYGVQEEKKKPEPVRTKPVPEIKPEREPLVCNPIEETDGERDEKLKEQLKNFVFRCVAGMIIIGVALALGNMADSMPLPQALTGDARKAYMMLFSVARCILMICGAIPVMTSLFKFGIGCLRGFKDEV